MSTAQLLGALCVLCALGMWLALESDRGPMAGALLIIGSFFGICAVLWGAGPLL